MPPRKKATTPKAAKLAPALGPAAKSRLADVTDARRAAAEHAPILTIFEDRQYVIPPSEDWDVDVLEAYEDGKVITAVRALLGAEQYAAWKKLGHGGRRTVGEFGEFAEAIMEQAGSGNS